jgi:hypothetical protein
MNQREERMGICRIHMTPQWWISPLEDGQLWDPEAFIRTGQFFGRCLCGGQKVMLNHYKGDEDPLFWPYTLVRCTGDHCKQTARFDGLVCTFTELRDAARYLYAKVRLEIERERSARQFERHLGSGRS